MKRRIHTTIATLVAASAVAVIAAPAAVSAPIAPTAGLEEIVAHIETTSIAKSKPKGGLSKKEKAKICANYETLFDSLVDDSYEAGQRGDVEGFDTNLEHAQEIHDNAKKVGCSWAR